MIKKHLRHLQSIFAATFLMLVIISCVKKQQSPALFGEIQFAALTTVSEYYKAVNSGLEPLQLDIPQKYWTERIALLKPTRIYTHRVNVVVVQDEIGNREKGIYIYLPYSSYYPQNGDDGFSFSSVSDAIYEYERSSN